MGIDGAVYNSDFFIFILFYFIFYGASPRSLLGRFIEFTKVKEIPYIYIYTSEHTGREE
jgi:hypothetical protein